MTFTSCFIPSFQSFTSLYRLAADTGGGAGGSEETKPVADLSTLPKAKARVAELESEVQSLTNARDQALSAQKAAEKARDQATTVATDTGKERDQAKADLATANGTISTLTTDLTAANTKLSAEKVNVDRLERLCGVKGLDPATLPPVARDPDAASGVSLYEQWSKLTGAAKTAFYRANQKALEGYAATLRG